MRTRELMCPAERGDTLAQFGRERLGVGTAPRRQADQPVDHRENILDTVAELAAEHLGLLGLALGFVNIGAGTDPADVCAVGVLERQRATDRPAVGAAGVAQAIFDLIGLAGSEAMAPALPRALLIVGVEHTVPFLAVGRAVGHAGKFIPAAVVIVVEAVGKRRPHHLRHGVGEQAEAGVALPQSVRGGERGLEIDFQNRSFVG